jgi:group I intron endonuclease
MAFVYLITNLKNGKCYVGKTHQRLQRRWSLHKQASKTPKTYLQKAMKGYGPESFDIQVLGEYPQTKDLSNLERVWIILLQSNNHDFGYNLTSGGEGTLGKKMSADHKKAVAKASASRVWSEESKEKLRLAQGWKNNSGYKHGVSNEEIIQLYTSGQSLQDIADHFGMFHGAIRNRLIKLGVALRGRNEYRYKQLPLKRSDVSSEEIKKLYEEGFSMPQIASRFNMSTGTVWSRLHKLNVEIRNSNG